MMGFLFCHEFHEFCELGWRFVRLALFMMSHLARARVDIWRGCLGFSTLRPETVKVVSWGARAVILILSLSLPWAMVNSSLS